MLPVPVPDPSGRKRCFVLDAQFRAALVRRRWWVDSAGRRGRRQAHPGEVGRDRGVGAEERCGFSVGRSGGRVREPETVPQPTVEAAGVQTDEAYPLRGERVDRGIEAGQGSNEAPGSASFLVD